MTKLKLLNHRQDWHRWKIENFSDPFDVCNEPLGYPCYGYAVVKNWTDQLEMARYLYPEDLENMLSALGVKIKI